jgi:hypothetical protein
LASYSNNLSTSPLINDDLPGRASAVLSITSFSASKRVTVCYQPGQAESRTGSGVYIYNALVYDVPPVNAHVLTDKISPVHKILLTGPWAECTAL